VKKHLAKQIQRRMFIVCYMKKANKSSRMNIKINYLATKRSKSVKIILIIVVAPKHHVHNFFFKVATIMFLVTNE